MGDEVEKIIETMKKLVDAMKRGRGRSAGNEVESKDKEGYYVEATEFPQFVPEYIKKEERHAGKIDTILSFCVTLDEFATNVNERGEYLHDFESCLGIDASQVYRLFGIDRERYVSRMCLFQKEAKRDIFREVEEMGRGYALIGKGLEKVPKEVLLNEPAFLLGYLNGFSEEFRLELKWPDEPNLESYYKDKGELAEKYFEKMTLEDEKQDRESTVTKEDCSIVAGTEK